MPVTLIRSAVEYLLGGPKVGGASEARLRRWIALPGPDLELPHEQARYVAVGTRATGADLRRDRLVAIGAVAVARMQLDLADCFTTAFRNDRASALVRGACPDVGGQAPPAGAVPEIGMLDLLDYTGKAPLVAFQAEFDRALVDRAAKSILGVPLHHSWIDLGAVLSKLFPEAGCTTLGPWLTHFGLGGLEREEPLAEALAVAQLLQIALVAADKAGKTQASHLIAMQRAPRRVYKR